MKSPTETVSHLECSKTTLVWAKSLPMESCRKTTMQVKAYKKNEMVKPMEKI